MKKSFFEFVGLHDEYLTWDYHLSKLNKKLSSSYFALNKKYTAFKNKKNYLQYTFLKVAWNLEQHVGML